MIKYDVFDDYGNAGSQIQVSEHWDDKKRSYLDDNLVTGSNHNVRTVACQLLI
ncbi:MAG: hypothetical protein ACEY3A_00655 [Wolbachia sp.]